MKRPKVSIIIPTYNSGETLACCLKSVCDQTYFPIEVIVVDGLSSDDTIRIAAEFGAKVIQQKSTPALARNIGIANSTGKYVLLIDSDQVLTPSVVEECVKNCESGNAEMVRIPEVFIGKNFWGSCSATWKNYYWKVEQKYRADTNILSGEPRFFLREQIALVGMLDPTLLWGEDYNLYKKLKKVETREVLCRSRLYHYEARSVRKIVTKNLLYGKSMPTFMHRSKEGQVLSLVIMHSLLTLGEILSDSTEKPAIIVGCTFLLGLKAFAMMVGFLTSLG
jgi:glycosyltransferase involved in cell wall biosynthesis